MQWALEAVNISAVGDEPTAGSSLVSQWPTALPPGGAARKEPAAGAQPPCHGLSPGRSFSVGLGLDRSRCPAGRGDRGEQAEESPYYSTKAFRNSLRNGPIKASCAARGSLSGCSCCT